MWVVFSLTSLSISIEQSISLLFLLLLCLCILCVCVFVEKEQKNMFRPIIFFFSLFKSYFIYICRTGLGKLAWHSNYGIICDSLCLLLYCYNSFISLWRFEGYDFKIKLSKKKNSANSVSFKDNHGNNFEPEVKIQKWKTSSRSSKSEQGKNDVFQKKELEFPQSTRDSKYNRSDRNWWFLENWSAKNQSILRLSRSKRLIGIK